MRQPGIVVWLTGLSAAGKTTISDVVFAELTSRDIAVEQLDGDKVRQYLSPTLTYTPADREENVTRISHLAVLLAKHGVVVLVSAISPFRKGRDEARERSGVFLEVYVKAPLALCEQRDCKGLYKKRRLGLVTDFTGIDHAYEEPEAPEVICYTDRELVAESAARVLKAIDAVLQSAADLSPMLNSRSC